MHYNFTRQELKHRGASEFKDGDCVRCGKYGIYIKYKDGAKEYKIPSLLTRVENLETNKFLDCTPGIGWPYYINEFIGR